MSATVSSLLPTNQPAPHDMVAIPHAVQSLTSIAPATPHKNSQTSVSSLISDIESFAKSDMYSICEAMRREDGALKIFIPGHEWDKGTITEESAVGDEVVINAMRKYDEGQNPFVFIELKRFSEDDSSSYVDGDDIQITPSKSNELVEKHTITINSAGKVKTSFPADRKFEVLKGIDALKSAVRRLLELEMYKERGVLSNSTEAQSVLKKLHVYDSFNPGKNANNLSESELKDMEKQLGDINKILQMVE